MENYEPKDYAYRLIEMKDEMEKAMTNIDTLIVQTLHLNEALAASPHKDEFIRLMDENAKNIDNYKSQKDTLRFRMGLLEEAIAMLEKNSGMNELMSMIFDALGIFSASVNQA